MFEEIYDVKKFLKVRCYLFEFYEVKKIWVSKDVYK